MIYFKFIEFILIFIYFKDFFNLLFFVLYLSFHQRLEKLVSLGLGASRVGPLRVDDYGPSDRSRPVSDKNHSTSSLSLARSHATSSLGLDSPLDSLSHDRRSHHETRPTTRRPRTSHARADRRGVAARVNRSSGLLPARSAYLLSPTTSRRSTQQRVAHTCQNELASQRDDDRLRGVSFARAAY